MMRILNCHLLDEIMFLYISYSITVFLRNYDVALTLTSLQSSRYLIGGSVLYYPQLSSISSYQLYVEVVCEELEWLPFYSGDVPAATIEGREDVHKGEIISRVLNVCSYWMTSFIKYSSWLENPSNVKAARFLSKGYIQIQSCSLTFCRRYGCEPTFLIYGQIFVGIPC
jgi:hypothetical protein